MLGVRIDLLTGRYAATRFDDRERTEWPPHPARLFSALVAAWADEGEPEDGRAALRWFEALPSPDIVASAASPRAAVTSFVPVNDVSVTRDLATLYHRIEEVGREIAAISAALADDPSSGADQKRLAKLVKELDKLRLKAEADARRGSAAKERETESTVRSGLALLPGDRGKQPRIFPTTIPEEPCVYFAWRDAEPPDEERAALDRLLARVARLGHSSSMVSCRVVDQAPPPTFVPDPEGRVQIRVTAPGLLDELELAHAQHQGSDPRTLPARMETYAPPVPRDEVSRPVMTERWTVLQLVGDRALPLRRALEITTAVRGAIMRHVPDPLPEVISGHQVAGDAARGTASTKPHLAIVPLPFVGREHADGGIRGIALVLPRETSPQDRLALLAGLAAWEAADDEPGMLVRLSRGRPLRLASVEPLSEPATLRSRTWCRPSIAWASVTPMALDRFPGRLWSAVRDEHEAAEAKAAQSIRAACGHVGLPEPIEVALDRQSFVTGVPGIGTMPIYRSPGRGTPRPTAHVWLRFAEPVAGPVLLGAGRYLGYGLFRPMAEPVGTQAADLVSGGVAS